MDDSQFQPPEQPQSPPPPPPTRGQSIWRAVLPPILHMVIQVVVTFFALIGALMPAYIAEFEETGLIPTVTPEDIMNSGATINALFGSAVVSILLFRYMYRRARRHFPVQTPGPASQIGLVAVVAIAGNFTLTSAITAAQNLMGTDMATSTLDGIALDADPLLLFLTVCIAAPIAEELCFRALAFNHLRRIFTFWQANFIQAAIFGLIHGNIWQIGYAFLFGLLLGWIYHRTRRFGAAVLAHIAFNTSNILLAFIPGIDALLENTLQLTLFLLLPAALVSFAGIRLIGSSDADSNGQIL